MQLTSLSLALTRAGFLSFSPASLFANGEVGAWYDPSDFIPDWRYNLLTKTEQFDDADWGKAGVSVIANASTAPNGTMTADRLVTNSGTSALWYLQQIPSGAVGALAFSIFAKADSAAHIGFSLDNSGVLAAVNLASGAITLNGLGITVVSLDAGWYKISLSASGNRVRIFCSTTEIISIFQTVTGDGTSGIYIWGASLTTAENASKPYQKITDGVQDYYTYQAQPVLFTDSAGTTPVTAVEQPVGLMLDKSKGLVLGPELVTNGTFDTNINGWAAGISPGLSTFSWDAGRLKGTYFSGGASFAQAETTVVGKWYAVTGTITAGSGSAGVYIQNSQSSFGPYLLTLSAAAGETKTVSGYFLATATTTWVHCYAGNTAGNITFFDNISVKELPGNHATQSTSASRPVLSARVNLLEQTQSFDNAYWTKRSATVTPNAAIAPDGTNTAGALVEAAATDAHRVSRSIGTVASSTLTTSIRFKAGVGSRNLDIALAAGANFFSSVISSTTGAKLFDNDNPGTLLTGKQISVSGPDEYGYYTANLTGTLTGSATVQAIYGLTSGTANSYAGDGTSGIYIWGADLRASNDGVGLPAYQRVNTSTDYDTTGFPMYLRFDGVDDFMVTNSINFTSTDKMTAWAGVRSIGVTANQMIWETSSNSFSTNGSSQLSTDTSGRYVVSSRGTAFSFTQSGTNASPNTVVATNVSDIFGDLLLLRINGTQAASSTADQGTGNYGNYPMFIGRRGGTSLPAAVRLHQLILRGAQSTAEQITATETYVNSKTKAFA
jgi:hypothetical protein